MKMYSLDHAILSFQKLYVCKYFIPILQVGMKVCSLPDSPHCLFRRRAQYLSFCYLAGFFPNNYDFSNAFLETPYTEELPQQYQINSMVLTHALFLKLILVQLSVVDSNFLPLTLLLGTEICEAWEQTLPKKTETHNLGISIRLPAPFIKGQHFLRSSICCQCTHTSLFSFLWCPYSFQFQLQLQL